jgi:hypothetical protein
VSQSDLLIETVAALEAAGVGYVLTGSLVSSLQGEPRATHDVDLVIEVDSRAVDGLAQAFRAPRYYFDRLAARDALDARGMFNLLDTASGDKVDFWALTDSEFDRSRFARRIETHAFGRAITVTAPEDTVLQKLAWAAASGGSERQMRDATGVYEVQAGRMDEAYLDEWAQRLGVMELLARVRLEAGAE